MHQFCLHAPMIRQLPYWILDFQVIRLSTRLPQTNRFKVHAGMLALPLKLHTELIREISTSLMLGCQIK
jgi:hypothetical protein